MTKEVVVQSWCDGPHDHREPAAIERTESLDGEPYLLDLCEVCDKSFEDTLEQVKTWLRRGVPVAEVQAPAPPRRTRSLEGQPRSRPEFNTVFMRTCQEPGCTDPRTGLQYLGPTRTALGQHVKSKHNKTLGDYDWIERSNP